MKFKDLNIDGTFTDPASSSAPSSVYIKLSENACRRVSRTDITIEPNQEILPYKKFTEIDETKRYLYFDNPYYE